jgi:hypothetical protein
MTKTQQALQMLADDKRRDIYETASSDRGQPPCGEFMISYGGGRGPVLTRREVETMLADGSIELKWPEHPEAKCYVLRLPLNG